MPLMHKPGPIETFVLFGDGDLTFEWHTHPNKPGTASLDIVQIAPMGIGATTRDVEPIKDAGRVRLHFARRDSLEVFLAAVGGLKALVREGRGSVVEGPAPVAGGDFRSDPARAFNDRWHDVETPPIVEAEYLALMPGDRGVVRAWYRPCLRPRDWTGWYYNDADGEVELEPLKWMFMPMA